MKALHKLAFILVIVGALNWGLVAISPSYDLVQLIFASWFPMGATLVYALVALSAVYLLVSKRCWKHCNEGTPTA